MTVAQTPRKAGPYTGNGVTTSFPFNFKVFEKTDVAVVRTNLEGVEATLVLDSDYSVQLNADQDANPGGTITYPILVGPLPLPTNWRLTVVGALAADQETDITNAGRFLPDVFERSLDKLTILIQQILEGMSRAVQVPVSGDLSPVNLVRDIFAARDQVVEIAANFADDAEARLDEIQAQGEVILRSMGYLVPQPYAAGLKMTSGRQTVSYGGETYAPIVDFLPFTTSGVFEAGKFRLIQGVSGADLAAPLGLPAFDFTGPEVQSILDNAMPFQTYAQMLAYNERAVGIRITTPGIDGVFRYNASLPHVTNGTTRFAHASGTGAWERLHDGRFLQTWAQMDKTGATSVTAKFQALIDAAAAEGATEIVLSGTSLLTCARNDTRFTCAIVFQGLKNCIVRGLPGTKFIVGPGGGGASEFAFFRLEQCQFVRFTGFEMDGSGISIIGTLGNRSNGFIGFNFDVNDWGTDLPTPNVGLEFDHLRIHDIGGGITMARRTLTLPANLKTEGLSVHDCQMWNLLGVDHGVSMPEVRGAIVRNNRIWNEIETVTIQDNMAFDASSGAEDVLIENNWVRGFVFGAKSESVANAGPGGNEVRSSKRVSFYNNTFEEIGDPVDLVWPGPGGGDTFGIKLNSQDAVAEGNTVSPRTVNKTTGGLGFSIAVVNTHNSESNCRVVGNRTSGAQIGILHNDTAPSTWNCSVYIAGNRCDDAVMYGILAQANVTVEDNRILQAGRSAIVCQTPSNSAFRRNIALNCGSTNTPTIGAKVVYAQEGSGAYAGFMEWTDNFIQDSRGGSAAGYGYFFESGSTYTNALTFRPGLSTGLATGISWDQYFSIIGESTQLGGTNAPAPRTIRTTNNPAITAPWSAMAWRRDDRAVLVGQAVGSAKGWVCTVAGTPGTWVSEGDL